MEIATDIKKDFQTFVFSNNVIIAAAGWSIGVATKEVITNVLNEVLLPLFILLGKQKFFINIQKRIFGNMHRRIALKMLHKFQTVSYLLIVWLLTIFLTFFILEFFLNRFVVGMKSTVKDQDKPAFVKATLDKQDSKTQQQKEKVYDENIKQELIDHGTINYMKTEKYM